VPSSWVIELLRQPTNLPFVNTGGKSYYLENRKGIRGLRFGVHTLSVEATDAPVTLLGVFVYDSRPNRSLERRWGGQAAAGETVSFSLPFRVRPMVICHGDLTVRTKDITRESVTFSGKGDGSFEVVGE
jgi:hypothetical protein